MKDLVLKFPIYSYDNSLLLPAGTDLTPAVLEEIVAQSKNKKYDRLNLLAYETVQKDLFNFLSVAPYNVIFADKDTIHEVMSLIETVEYVEPILRSLDYFKKYDFHTYRHVLMVVALSSLLSKTLFFKKHDVAKESLSGPCHDFGKIAVPLQILNKRDPLTRKERALMEQHTLAGYVLLAYYFKDAGHIAALVARDHHERRDGSGYPRGVNEVDPLVEVVAVSDIYDALISPRPYRPVSFDNRTALEVITQMAEEGQINWQTVQALVALNRQTKPHFEECEVSVEKRGTPPACNSYGKTAEDEESA